MLEPRGCRLAAQQKYGWGATFLPQNRQSSQDCCTSDRRHDMSRNSSVFQQPEVQISRLVICGTDSMASPSPSVLRDSHGRSSSKPTSQPTALDLFEMSSPIPIPATPTLCHGLTCPYFSSHTPPNRLLTASGLESIVPESSCLTGTGGRSSSIT